MCFVIGVILVGMGLLIWKKQKIELIHTYHYKNVKDIKGYTAVMGKTIASMGGVIIISGLLALIPQLPAWVSTAVLYLGIGGSVVALVIVQQKFNGSIFSK